MLPTTGLLCLLALYCTDIHLAQYEGYDGGYIDGGYACILPDGGIVNPSSTIDCYDGPIGTEGVGICHKGIKECIEGGRWGLCIQEQVPLPEQCNCLDNDCDGIVGNIPNTQFCYDGPTNTAGVGICHPGVVTCDPSGCQQICKDEQTPQPEICNGLDNDCDGKVLQTTGLVDVVFILDNTDSSCEDGLGQQAYNDAKEAIMQFVAQYATPNFQYGLIEVPGCGVPATGMGYYSIFQAWGSEQLFVQTLQKSTCLYSSIIDPTCAAGETYWSFDLLDLQVNGGLLPWESGAQRWLVFIAGDEGESQYNIPQTAGVQLDQDMANQYVTPVLFIAPNSLHSYDIAMLQSVGGSLYEIGTPAQMLAEMDQVMNFPCRPDGG